MAISDSLHAQILGRVDRVDPTLKKEKKITPEYVYYARALLSAIACFDQRLIRVAAGALIKDYKWNAQQYEQTKKDYQECSDQLYTVKLYRDAFERETNKLKIRIADMEEAERKREAANKKWDIYYIRLNEECLRRIREQHNADTPGWKIPVIRELRALLNAGLADCKSYSEQMQNDSHAWFCVKVDALAFEKNTNSFLPYPTTMGVLLDIVKHEEGVDVKVEFGDTPIVYVETWGAAGDK